MNISREQIKKAFVSKVEDIDEYAYNNQDWYQQDEQRIRYILATIEMDPGDRYSETILSNQNLVRKATDSIIAQSSKTTVNTKLMMSIDLQNL